MGHEPDHPRMPPWWYEQNPTIDEPAPRGSQKCFAWINRTVNPDDHVTAIPKDGNLEPCKFTIANFPPGSPHPIWESMPEHCRPPSVDFAPPCLEFDPKKFTEVKADFSIKISCGCGIGRNQSVWNVNGTTNNPGIVK